MAPPAPPAARSQFHRFRLSDFHRVDQLAPPAVGQCSRFRVSDFVPYGGSSTAAPHVNQINGHSSANGGATQPAATAGNASTQGPPNAGNYSVLHMDIDASAAQNTSKSVAATGGKGLLQRINVPAGSPSGNFQNPPPPIALPQPPQHPLPASPRMGVQAPIAKFDPAQYPEDIRWELARVLDNIQTNPTGFTTKIINALLASPSLEQGSLLRHICALYPQVSPPVPSPVEAEAVKPGKRKRGRPPTKKPVTISPAAAHKVPIPPNGPTANAMGPPAPITVIPSRKEKDSIQTCTRCLKSFNPALRPTPASDPSSEATCAVRHPFPDFASGLVPSLVARKRNRTWRWRCCGREIQSTSDELVMWPRKEDDTTAGWCFVGRHTTDPAVREKFGLKPGPGKTIDEVADIPESMSPESRKRAKLDDSTIGDGGNSNSQSQWASESVYSSEQAQQTSQQDPPANAEPVKRKRGRPKGSKTRNKLPSLSGPSASPTSQLLSEASQAPANSSSEQTPSNAGSNFWTQYTEPHLPDESEPDAMGMSSVELGMLVSATAAMTEQPPAAEQPVKRGRGRPKGVKNGAGKAAVEKKRLAEQEQRRQLHQQQHQHQQEQPQPQPQPEEEQHVVTNTIPAGAGGGWFPGDDQGWGGFG